MESFLKRFKEPKYLLQIAIIAVVYIATAKFGLSLAYSYKQVTLVWPPTGVAIAVLLLYSRSLWPGITIGAFLVNLSTDITPFMASGIALGNTLEAFVAVYLLEKVGFDRSLSKVKDVLKFLFFAVIIGTAISATIGTTSLIYGGIGSWSNFFPVWLTWWVGDGIGAMVFGGFILAWSKWPNVNFNFGRFLEIIFLAFLTGYVSVLIFTPLVSPLFSMHPFHFEYAILPTLFWVSYRFRQKGSTLAVLLVSGIAIWGTLIGDGPFTVEGNPEQSLLLLQLFIGVTSLTCMAFSAVIEEKVKAEDTILNREKRFRALIENSYDAVVLVDPKGVIKYASPSTKRLWGYEPNEVEGLSGFKLIYKDDRLPSLKVLSKLVLSPNKSMIIENRIVRKDGKVRWMDAIGTNLLLDPDVNAIVINFRDITDRKKLDEAKTEFVSLSAHQLRAPLSIIRWYTEALLKEKKLPSKVMSNLNEVYASTLSMNEIVTLLLEISKFEAGMIKLTTSKVNLELIIDEVFEQMKVEISKKKLKVTKEIKNNTPKIIGDIKLVKIIIEILIANAIKYTKTNGSITLKLKEEQNGLLLSIKDTGIGIPVEDYEKIFTKLFRGSNVKDVDGTGMGLGLYLLRLIMDISGGKIWFESEVDKGTTFFVTFPKKLRNINK